MRTSSLSVVALACLAGGCIHLMQDIRYLEPRELEVEGGGVTAVHVMASAGGLTVVGRDDLTEVEVTGVAGASHEELLDQIGFSTHREGDVLVVAAEIPDSIWDRGAAKLDMTIHMPTGAGLRVDDGSGATTVSDVAWVEINDGSGSIGIQDVAGSVTIHDGSGSIALSNVGSVGVTDGSGSIVMETVLGDVTVFGDGSGGISITDVSGSVHIHGDGSGSIVISHVAGSVRIDEDGSGGISVSDVRGDLYVGEEGSGSVSYSSIGGEVRVHDD